MRSSPEYCASCEMVEPIPPGTTVHIVCFECNHVYRTDQDLVDTFNDEIARANTIIEPASHLQFAESADEIRFCPLCLHDF